MKIFAIRGAITVDADTPEQVTARSVELMKTVAERNPSARPISVIISTTEDIRSFYPARAIRESGVTDAPLFSCKEPEIKGALPLCIRVLVTAVSEDDGAKAVHAYLGKAAALRRDLA